MQETRTWPAVALALGATAWLAPSTPPSSGGALAGGGLAVIVVLLVGALAFGLPIARLRSREDVAVQAVSTGIAATALATPLAVLWPHAPVLAFAGALAIWLLAAPRWSRHGVGVVVVLALGLFAIGTATLSYGRYTLLEPWWTELGTWGPGALAVGALLAAPTVGGAPSVTARSLGFSVLGATWLALWLAFLWPESSPAAGLLPLAAGAAAVFGASAQRDADGLAPTLIGALVTVLLAGPGHNALPTVWSTLLPLSVAYLAGRAAWRSRGIDRWMPGGAALGLVGLALYNWPGAPEGVPAAIVLALVPVIFVWVVGSDLVRRRTA